MSQQDKHFERLFIDKFSKFSKADSDLKWKMMIEALIESNKSDERADKLEAELKNSVPMDVVMGLVDALKVARKDERESILENAPGFDGPIAIETKYDEALAKFEQWQIASGKITEPCAIEKGRGE